MDLLIEANLATIQVLEALAQKIETLSPEEASKLTLGNNLGGSSEVIYVNSIKRVYADKGAEVLEHLKKSPAASVAVVLRRLKIKDEEWRRNQREWAKVWKEIHNKNHYKSLDHQGVNFKNNDRKIISSKTLIGEIEAILQEQKRASVPGSRSSKKKEEILFLHQLEYSFSDQRLLKDILGLIAFNVKRGNFSSSDRQEIVGFLSTFVQKFFAFKPPVSLDQYLLDDDNDDDMDDDVVDDDDDDDKQIEDGMDVDDVAVTTDRTNFVFYANNAFYTFFRLLQVK